MTARLLIVDADAKYAEWLRNHLGVICTDADLRVMTPVEFDATREVLTYDNCDLVLLASNFGESPRTPALMASSCCARSARDRRSLPCCRSPKAAMKLTAVRALQLGAVDYLPKKLLNPERLGNAVRLALRRIERRAARRRAKLTQSGELAARNCRLRKLRLQRSPRRTRARARPGQSRAGLCHSLAHWRVRKGLRVSRDERLARARGRAGSSATAHRMKRAAAICSPANTKRCRAFAIPLSWSCTTMACTTVTNISRWNTSRAAT